MFDVKRIKNVYYYKNVSICNKVYLIYCASIITKHNGGHCFSFSASLENRIQYYTKKGKLKLECSEK